ncbi:NADP+-dependent D-mannitol dehydrogenase [Stereum hirsutum FP-91666 SS1]|uniref:NADP+-dependent D-mannitol dehydrogenase n=1 Tax=Stereum hirsutum (strain FP-91666) TaxID=721885 RepID=UPI000444A288|nr:NADP+-dependent D-mannitol dehydrogenase [Stereum hirsutum FP-91666 SS1]EIM82471.1 NADP+-dependent D-mannitol dehydrogenase [Stereum hirsutum FP-91666 SS1]
MPIPETMKAVYYHSPRNFEILEVPVPQIGDEEVLVKVSYCGICGTDSHVHEGEFVSKFPLIPGHEVVGKIEAIGKNVKGLSVGDRCVADPGVLCDDCFYCRRGKGILCENFEGKGVSMAGGFAEFVTFAGKQVYKISNMSDKEATLLEPAACAIHGMDKLGMSVGAEVLMIGSGPTGLMMCQLLKINGATKVVLAANKGIKMDIAKSLDVADEYVELDRSDPEAQWKQLKENNPYGFDVVVEATGVESIANESINYVRRGGKLLIYGVYANADRVHWPPSKIFGDEITILGSFAQAYCFPRAVDYLESGKIKTKGIVTDEFNLDDFQKALDKMKSRSAVKIAIKAV